MYETCFRLGLIEDDGGEPTLDKVGNQYRLNSILIRGTNQMSTKDIFAYLRDNNQRPLNMEWVNDACCKLFHHCTYYTYLQIPFRLVDVLRANMTLAADKLACVYSCFTLLPTLSFPYLLANNCTCSWAGLIVNASCNLMLCVYFRRRS